MVHFWVKMTKNECFMWKSHHFYSKLTLIGYFWTFPRSCVRLIVLLLIWRSISYFLCLFLFTYLLFIIFYLLTNEKQMTSTFQNSIKSTLCAGPLSLMGITSNPRLTFTWVTWGHLRSLRNKNKFKTRTLY